jgi:cephalosporin hydroxylase
VRLASSFRHRLDNFLGRLERLRARSTVRRFHRLYYSLRQTTWTNTRFLGVPVAKNPLDLWVYQEIIFEVRPDLIVEAGTAHGGSALYMATVCDLVGRGRVVSVDIAPVEDLPRHERVTFIKASSTDPATTARIEGMIRPGEAVMVVLDSDHKREHVLEELRLYAPLVTPGSYLILEDTNLNGRPVMWRHGPGPSEALEIFLRTHPEFEPDASREKFLFTFNPRGYLRKRPGG